MNARNKITFPLSILDMLQDPTHTLIYNVQARVDIAKIDPFVEAKKKCLPKDIEDISFKEWDNVSSEVLYYSVSPFTIADRDWPSFTDIKMSNLILDEDWNLLKLIQVHETQESLPPNQTYIEAEEFYNWNWLVIARKFLRHVSAS